MKAHGIIIVINNRCERIENSKKFELLKSFHYSSISPFVTISVVNNRVGTCLKPWINKYRALTFKLNAEVGIFPQVVPHPPIFFRSMNVLVGFGHGLYLNKKNLSGYLMMVHSLTLIY